MTAHAESSPPLPRSPAIALAAVATISTVDDLLAMSSLEAVTATLALGGLAVAVVGFAPMLGLLIWWSALIVDQWALSPATLAFPALVVCSIVQATRGRRLAAANLLATTAGISASTLRASTIPARESIWLALGLAMACLALGEIVRSILTNRARTRHLETLRERDRVELEARLARAHDEERASLARALHDIVASQLTIIAATVAGAQATPDPSIWRSSLDTIDRATVAALSEMRELLHTLDQPPGSAVTDTRVRPTVSAPEPASTRLANMVTTLTGLGREVRLDVDTAALAGAPADTGTGAVREVREALTNALRHGADGPLDIRVAAEGGGLDITVINPLGTRDSPSAGSGRGLVGLAHTVTNLGGTLESGPGAGQWRLQAHLPVIIDAG